MKIRELFENTQLPPQVAELVRKFPSTWVISREGKLEYHSTSSHLALFTTPELIANNELVIPLADFKGDFDAMGMGLISFKNFPENIEGSLFAGSNNFSSFEGVPKSITGLFDISGCQHINTLSGIHKHLQYCSNIMLPSESITNSLLGLLKIKNLESIELDDSDEEPGEDFLMAIRIINRHLHEGRNIVACQEDLFKNNLDAYAKL